MTIEYRGQVFKLTRNYSSYEEYVDDPSNLDSSENARIAHAVATATVPKSCASIDDIVEAVSDITFPGFGSGTLVPEQKNDFGWLVGMTVEIPRTDSDRHILYRKEGNKFVLIDDFLAAREPKIWGVRVDGNVVRYFAGRDVVITRDQPQRDIPE